MQNVSRKVKITGRLIKLVFVALLAASLLLSGCRDSSEPLDRAEASQPSTEQSANANNTSGKSLFSDALYCHVTEKSISDPTKGFVDDPENRTKYPSLVDSFADAKMNLSLTDSFSAAGTLYLLYNITYTMEENKEYIEIPSTYYFLYTLEAPYEQWYCYPFSSDCWATINPDSSITIPNIKSIAGVCKNGVYFQLLSGDIGYYSQFGDSRLMEEFKTDSESPATFTLYHTDETLYAVSTDLFSNGSFTSYDEQLKPVLTQNLENQLYGCFSSGSEFLWYGFDEQQNLVVWDKPNGTQLFSLGNMVNSYSDFLLTKSAAGEFILADISGIWAGDGTAPMQKILSFAERGYVLQELLALNVNEDGSLFLITQFEDSLCLLILEGSDEPDRQEVTVVSTDTASLSDVVASFNRQNDKYRVTLVNPFDSDDFSAYCQQLQMEISAGRGPDLVQAGLIDLAGCIDNGYVESLEDVIQNPADYWPGCLEYGERNGVLYSIPYYMVVSCLTASESLTGGLNAWTLEQMMEAVRRSPAESLEIDLDSLNIVLQYGLGIRDNTQFIDYDAGVSHLAEQPFIDFLEFAKKYGDNLYYTANSDYSEAAEYYHDGRLAFYTLTMYDPSRLLFSSVLFQGQDALIGMPSTQGRGVYMGCNALALNNNSPSKDCAREFLRYLMSREGQIEFVRNTLTFSCRKDVTEMILEDYQLQSAESESSYGRFGLISKSTPLSDEQIEQLFSLFEDARPKWELPSEIYNIACEELEPYFVGDCSAEDAAWKLSNRVQLYLDERK
ncbi:MAG: extracellular solute-binding protein [Acetatifactor sp.]|nr:extracellular solute-binding protein [Acetatifactor sp.]